MLGTVSVSELVHVSAGICSVPAYRALWKPHADRPNTCYHRSHQGWEHRSDRWSRCWCRGLTVPFSRRHSAGSPFWARLDSVSSAFAPRIAFAGTSRRAERDPGIARAGEESFDALYGSIASVECGESPRVTPLLADRAMLITLRVKSTALRTLEFRQLTSLSNHRTAKHRLTLPRCFDR